MLAWEDAGQTGPLPAVMSAVFGEYSPAGKLPYTVYPASFVNESNFFEMSLTKAPGRTYGASFEVLCFLMIEDAVLSARLLLGLNPACVRSNNMPPLGKHTSLLSSYLPLLLYTPHRFNTQGTNTIPAIRSGRSDGGCRTPPLPSQLVPTIPPRSHSQFQCRFGILARWIRYGAPFFLVRGVAWSDSFV
jgi:hypothetical protein